MRPCGIRQRFLAQDEAFLYMPLFKVYKYFNWMLDVDAGNNSAMNHNSRLTQRKAIEFTRNSISRFTAKKNTRSSCVEGSDSRGIARQCNFDKGGRVKFVHPCKSKLSTIAFENSFFLLKRTDLTTWGALQSDHLYFQSERCSAYGSRPYTVTRYSLVEGRV